jgi:hypothetical protein
MDAWRRLSLHTLRVAAPCTLRIVHINDVYELDNMAEYATTKKQEALAPEQGKHPPQQPDRDLQS